MLSVPLGNIDQGRSQEGNYFGVTLRHVTLGIAFMEVMMSSWCAGLLLYSTINYDHVVKQLLQLPKCLAHSSVLALLNSLSFICGIECVLGAWLFEAVKRNKLRHIYSWLLILLTYETLLAIFVIFLGIAGCTTDQINRLTFFRVFFRFMEFLVIFIFMESEAMKRMRRKARRVREMLARRDRRGDASNATSISNLLTCDNYLLEPENLEPTKALQDKPIQHDIEQA